MYKRVEQIEEENLDWDQPNARHLEEQPGQKENIIFSPAFKSKKILWENIPTFDIKKLSVNFLEKNTQFSSFMGILLLPYFVGFLVTYVLFFSYGGMSIITFLSIDKEYILLQLWSIGAYMFVTSWVFWAFSHIIQTSKLLLPLHNR